MLQIFEYPDVSNLGLHYIQAGIKLPSGIFEKLF
jgi:hypothetical protein